MLNTKNTLLQSLLSIAHRFYHSTFVRFGIIGALGFAADAIALYALRADLGLMTAKVVSYIIAVTVTWVLNRTFTFQSHDPKRMQQWLKYAVVYCATGGLHLIVFAYLINRYTIMHDQPIYALFITAAINALINFFVVQRVAFKPATAA